MRIGIESWIKGFYNSPHLTRNQRVGSLQEKAIDEALKLNKITPGNDSINDFPERWIQSQGLSFDQGIAISKKRNGFRRSLQTIYAIEIKNFLSAIMTKGCFENEVLPRFKGTPKRIGSTKIEKVLCISGHVTKPAKDLAEKEDITIISLPSITDPSDLPDHIRDVATILRRHEICYALSSKPYTSIDDMGEMIDVNAFGVSTLDFSTIFGVFLILLMIISIVFS